MKVVNSLNKHELNSYSVDLLIQQVGGSHSDLVQGLV